MERFLEFCEAWDQRYPAIVRLWENAWAEFVPFLNFDVEIRNVVCSTDEIVNRRQVAGVVVLGCVPSAPLPGACRSGRSRRPGAGVRVERPQRSEDERP